MSRQTLSRVALLAALGAELAAGAILYAGPARASDVARQVTVTVGWSGDGCVTIIEPDAGTRRTSLTERNICNPEQGSAITYLSKPGEYYGVAVRSNVSVGVACNVQIGSRTVAFESGMDVADCIGRW